MRYLIDLLKLLCVAVIALAAGGLFQMIAESNFGPFDKWITILLVTTIVLIATVISSVILNLRSR